MRGFKYVAQKTKNVVPQFLFGKMRRFWMVVVVMVAPRKTSRCLMPGALENGSEG